MAFKKLTRVEEFDLVNLIKAHCKEVDGFAVYDEGWSDEKIRETHGNCSVNSVGSIRQEFIGKLRRPRYVQVSVEALEKRIADLEKNVITCMLLTDKLLSWAKTRGYDAHILSNGSGSRPISRPPAP